jgi:purine-binding chemotaxis protein CheW
VTTTRNAGSPDAEMPGAEEDRRTQYLSFILAGHEYAIEILRVREIIEYDVLTRVPAMPPAVRGVINLRGRVVPVVDLAEAFALPPATLTPRSCIVVVEIGGGDGGDGPTVVGIITDAVCEVFDLAAAEVQAPPAFGTAVGAEFLDGLAEAAARKFTMLLNVDRAIGAVTQPQSPLTPAADAE